MSKIVGQKKGIREMKKNENEKEQTANGIEEWRLLGCYAGWLL
jgi:hypothetical protein